MMSALDMYGMIDNDFKSTPAQRIPVTGGYVLGKWVDDAQTATPEPYDVTLQPATSKEIDILVAGGERIIDARRVYINSGDLKSLSITDLWTFDGVVGKFKVIKPDIRVWHNYCKLIVSRIDES